MNLLDLHQQPTARREKHAWVGTWARIWMQPSVFSAQKFVVGIVMLDKKGLCDFQFITGTEKFECLYGPPGRTVAESLLAAGRAQLAQARETHAPIGAHTMPPGLFLEPVGYAADKSAAHALENALCEAEIPMEPFPEAARAPRFKSRTGEEVVADVINAIKLKMKFKASDVLRTDHFGDEKHTGMVNLVLPNSAGIVASGWYASSERVQLELLKAANMVESYMALHQKAGKAGVFFLRPTTASGLNRSQSLEIETALDQLDYHLEQKGLRVATRDLEGELAEDVAEWVSASGTGKA